MSDRRCIELRGVEVHNLKQVDVDIPHGRLVVVCGLSGSGKSSLAIDTLYAEGQRRYIESFSAYTRQFLEQLEKPAARRIDHIPPAIAVAGENRNRSSRATVGTATEIVDYLRLLFARIGRVVCPGCGRHIRRETPQSAAEALQRLDAGHRLLVAFRPTANGNGAIDWSVLRESGFVRAIVDGQWRDLSDLAAHDHSEPTADRPAQPARPASAASASHGGSNASEADTAQSDDAAKSADAAAPPGRPTDCYVVVDRLVSGRTDPDRLRDSLETAFQLADGQCFTFVEQRDAAIPLPGSDVEIDGRRWRATAWSQSLRCEACQRDFPTPEPRLFSFNSPLGACPACEGFGNVIDIDMDLVVPDPRKSLRQGAIAPWTTPAYRHELDELLALADDYGIDADIPFEQLDARQRQLIHDGVPERDFGGLRGFFAWLERRKYKMHIRVFLSRWRSYRTCAQCGGTRLRDEALHTQVGGRNIAEISAMKVRDAAALFDQLELSPWEATVGKVMLEQIRSRLHFLEIVGLGYLTLDRALRTLSGGESRRVTLTSALGSSLVNMLYVLDEPSIGLHPRDVGQLLDAIGRLRDRGNTVVVVEHEPAFIRAADEVIEIGPGAGEHGGRIVFQGTPDAMLRSRKSLTGQYLNGHLGARPPERRRQPRHGWIRLSGARGNNLKNLRVEFPLGVLCVVTGVSGSGKSTLIQDTLYPALCRRMRKTAPKSQPYDDVLGDGQLNDVIFVDQGPLGRSPRSNPVTYIKAFDAIRAVFAETVDARTRNYTASHFSFNVKGGRCERCQGDGHLEIDMQFLADVYMKCPECQGARYRPEILDVLYRGRNIADVLEMTVREAFTFFRGHPKVQARLKRLIDVGLDYLRLGQPANTLSGGEAQRLKLAAHMSSVKRGRSLFLLDEPTTGLHPADVVQLLDCFDALISVGHSLIVVEHNLDIIQSADYIIDLGPGAADEGGRLVASGTPEQVAAVAESVTGQFLKELLATPAAEASS